MTHDLIGFRPQDGESVEDSLERLAKSAASEPALTSDEQSALADLADRVSAVLLTEPGRFDGERSVELTTARLDVFLCPDEVGISLLSEVDWREAAAVHDVLREAGFHFYDQSAGRVVESDEFHEAAVYEPPPPVAEPSSLRWWRRLLRP